MFADVLDVQLEDPFPRMTWHEAMRRFGSDKPDLRIGLELVDIDELVAGVEFKVFSGPAADPASRVAALRVPGGAELSRKQIDDYAAFAGRYGAKGLAWMKVNDADAGADGVQSPIAKFLDDDTIKALIHLTAAESGDLILFGAGESPVVAAFMGALRVKIGHDRGLVEQGWKPLWVVDFPMFEFDEDDRATTRCTTRSPHRPSPAAKRSRPTRLRRFRAPTTWCSTAPRSAAARFVFTIRSCSRPRSTCWASRNWRRSSASAFCSRR